MVLLDSPDRHPSSFAAVRNSSSSTRPAYSHSDSMASMCGSPEPGEFAVPSSMSDSSETERSRRRDGDLSGDLIPGRKQREFTPDTRKDDTYWDRRRRNNEAAKRSREKRRMNDMVLETRVMELTTENQWLKAELHALRDKCGIPKDAPPMVNPNAMPSSSSSGGPLSPSNGAATSPSHMSPYGHPMKEQFQQLRTSQPSQQQQQPPQLMHIHPQFLHQQQQQQQQQMARGMPVMHPMHPALMAAHPAMAGRMLIPNQPIYIPGGGHGMIPMQYAASRQLSCQSVSPIPRSSSSGSHDSLDEPRENGGAISPSIAAVSSLLKLANSHFNGYPHMPRDHEDSETFPSSHHQKIAPPTTVTKEEPTHNSDSEVNNHLPLKLRYKTRIEYEQSPSPPLSATSSNNKVVPKGSTSESSSSDGECSLGDGGSGEDSAVDMTECTVDNRKRKAPTVGGPSTLTESKQMRGELLRLASEVATLQMMIKNPVEGSVAAAVAPPPAKKQRKSRSRRT
ncbi:putative Nuclear factor interleukin-3-regulated protein [Hypsibius exemplaris]|uniref:Nuclear factor interleukin-3-regulated protein n=1 Tax=Hypsibius exemplaris TaxID=2072580 RepID=A0A1W0WPH2_HYPEX|nr:putative Nuclear factor interleukin-3-regulated protein [Hypsibius exemplaris]